MAVEPFEVKDCALIAIATGRRAASLKELREHLQVVPRSSIYHHLWGARVETSFEEPEYTNDFAAWVRHHLHDRALAERLSAVDPGTFPDLEAVRHELVELIEERLDETGQDAWAYGDRQFELLRSQIVVFDTKRSCRLPEELAEVAPHLSLGSVFYHFIDARRRRDDALDDFRAWLASFGDRHTALINALAGVDYYFSTLSELRDELARVFRANVGVR